MSDLAFPPELRTASIVPRWSVVWTLNKDYVSNHSWFVMIYANDIAMLLNWPGNIAAVMYLAGTHDLDELTTGDLVSPVKREIIDEARAAAYIEMKMQERLPQVLRHIEMYENSMSKRESAEAWAIISAADRLDALLFLITEQRLGNTIIGPRVPDIQDRLEAAWYELPAERGKLQELWNTQVMPSITAHRGQGGFGI